MAKIKKAALEAEFKHGTSIGINGETLYDCPMEIKDQQDLNNYGITWDDCRTLNFHGSEKVTVYFYKTENRAFAEYQWSYLDTKHSRGFASVRCMIPGKRRTGSSALTQTLARSASTRRTESRPSFLGTDWLRPAMSRSEAHLQTSRSSPRWNTKLSVR